MISRADRATLEELMSKIEGEPHCTCDDLERASSQHAYDCPFADLPPEDSPTCIGCAGLGQYTGLHGMVACDVEGCPYRKEVPEPTE